MELMILIGFYCILGAITGISWFGNLGTVKYFMIPVTSSISIGMIYQLLSSGEPAHIAILGIISFVVGVVIAVIFARA